MLPDKENPVLTRELFYTGLTRTRKSVRILADEGILRFAIETRAQRFSGLSDALCSKSNGVIQFGVSPIPEKGAPTASI